MRSVAQVLTTFNSDNFIFDDEVDSQLDKKKQYREHQFTVDPLAVVVDYYNAGKQGHEIYDNIVNYNNLHNPTMDSLQQAEIIRKYFQNKLLMRRLRNEHVSQFMLDMEALLEDCRFVRSDRLPILVKLPALYKESIATEALFKNYNSLVNDRGIHETNEVWTYVTEISKYLKNEKTANFYFSNRENNLLKIAVPYKDMGVSVWNYISSKKEIGIKTTLVRMRVKGYDFCLYNLPNSYELFDPR